MTLNKPSLDMQQDLNSAALDLKRIAIGMLGMAVRLSEAGLDGEALKLLAMARDIGDIEDVTKAYADEIHAGVVVRASIN
jgi:hypothetical protein